MGYITVVGRQYPRALTLTEFEADETSTKQVFGACTPDGSRCYRQEVTCDADAESCAWTSMEGDPSRLKDSWTSFGGLSSNYLVIYLEQAAGAGTWFAATINGGARMEAGYHLVATRPLTASEKKVQSACSDQAYAEALRVYTEAHGAGPTFEEAELFEEQLQKSFKQLGCTEADAVYNRVGNPSKESITVHIRRDVGLGAEQASGG